MKFVVGHKNPDTDSVISAIVFILYLKKMKVVAIPAIIGKLNRETELVLKTFKMDSPELLKKAPKESEFYLVDHNELKQSIDGLKEENILGVIDHHQLSGIKTASPILYRSEVLGSTCTLLAKMFQEKGWKLNKQYSSLLLAGIISDTLNFSSSTATLEDKKMAKELNQLAKININKLSEKMFSAKSDISGKSIKEIIMGDCKEYDINSKRVGVGVFETLSTESFAEKREQILRVIRKIKKEKGYDFFFFGLINIREKSTLLYLADDKEVKVAIEAFKISSIESGIGLLKGFTSRKKQIIPPLFKAIK